MGLEQYLQYPLYSFVFRRMVVADGNFKADHVRQKSSNSDIWLWDGGGMAPNQKEYNQFLLSATERLTVCEDASAGADAD
jgi:hypothetical protein